MFRHFCPNLVSRNSTATTVSMHGIVSLLKPWRALWRGYTPPKRWSRHVEITCSLHCMQLEYPRSPPGNIHALHRWLTLPGSDSTKVCQVTMDPRQKPSEPDSVDHLNIWSALVGPALLECSSWRQILKKNSRWIFLKSNTWSNSANPRWTMHHVRPPWEEQV